MIVEDDNALANGLCRALATEEIETESCGTLKYARIKMAQEAYCLMILDVNLPDGNGLDYLQEMKQQYDIPVIILTANDMEIDIVSGLEAGAEDYVTKPFSLAVLRARVNTQLRKMQFIKENHNNKCRSNSIVEIDEYIFDFDRMEYSYRGELIELSKTEQKLLRYLIDNRGNTLSRTFLIDRIWTDQTEYVDENALSVSIKRLRDKLSAQEYIKTVYGIGYVWDYKENHT